MRHVRQTYKCKHAVRGGVATLKPCSTRTIRSPHMKRALCLAVLLSTTAALLSACIVVPPRGGPPPRYHYYHDRY